MPKRRKFFFKKIFKKLLLSKNCFIFATSIRGFRRKDDNLYDLWSFRASKIQAGLWIGFLLT